MTECDVCHKRFEQRRHLRLHFARTHVERSKWTSRCTECGKVYADDEILRRHMRNHEKRKTKMVCPVPSCDCSFFRKAFLDKHIAANHPETLPRELCDLVNTKVCKKKYCCNEPLCEASFDKHHLLTQHFFVHTGISPFPCIHCEKRFLTLNHKNRHEKMHAGYPCPQCDEVAKTWSALLTHKAHVHRKEYKCEDCDKVFLTSSRLKQHSDVHAEVRRVFQCSSCDRNFTRRNSLSKHISIVHEGAKLFKCLIEGCNKSYAHCTSLKQHITRCHEAKCKEPRKISRYRKKNPAAKILGMDSKAIEAAMGIMQA